MTPEAICLALWIAVGAGSNPLISDSNSEICLEVAKESIAQGVNPIISVSVGWVESRFTYATSSAGARGPLQIIPRYWCPNGRLRGCDLVARGVHALKTYYNRHSSSDRCGGDFLNSRRYREWLEPLCHYNSGNICNRSSRFYARSVVNIATSVSRIYSSNSN